jgi:DNA primase
MQEDYIEKIRNALSIVEVVKEKVKLSKKGREYQGLCPFHGEKTPSFYVNATKGFYYCFGCQAKGNIFNFYMDIYHMSFVEAIEALAKKANISLPQNINFQANDQKQKLYDICTLAKNYFVKQLNSVAGVESLQYLQSRGISKESIQKFELGYACGNNSELWKLCEQQNIYEEDLLILGLKNHSKNGDSYDFFHDRLMFPIKDKQGRTIGFGGRTLTSENPKYLNSKESPIFYKKSNLYGLHESLSMLKDSNNILLVEGYMDVIALHQHGFPTAVAGLGTAISEEHVKAIRKYDASPRIILDGDNAGKKATMRLIDLYLSVIEIGDNPQFVFLELNEDPDSYINKEGAVKFQEKLNASKSLSEVLWHEYSFGKNLVIPEISMQVMKLLEEKVYTIQNKQIRNNFLRYLQNNMYESSKRFYKKGDYNKYISPIKSYKIESTKEREGIMLSCIIMYPTLYYEVEEQLGQFIFTDEKLEMFRLFLIEKFNDSNINVDMLELVAKNQIEDIVEYILNINLVKPIVKNMQSIEEARNHFDSAYLFLQKEALQTEQKKLLKQLSILGKELQLVKDSGNQEQIDSVEYKIKILLKQSQTINNYIKEIAE